MWVKLAYDGDPIIYVNNFEVMMKSPSGLAGLVFAGGSFQDYDGKVYFNPVCTVLTPEEFVEQWEKAHG